MARNGLDLDAITTFGELLRHLRRRARLTQQELGIAVGYSEGHVASLESGQHSPNPAAVRVRFLEPLDLQHEPALAQRLMDLAEQERAIGPSFPEDRGVSHPFGDLLSQYRTRKHGLSQRRLAELVGYDPSLVAKMAMGRKELTGPSGRDRVVRIIATLRDEGALTTLGEANALLKTAGMPPLFEGQPAELALIQSLMADDATARTAPLRRLTNLPAPLTRFIGREHEMAAVAHLVGTNRLVTLTGSGGMGKTRLAIEVGASLVGATTRVTPAFPDGVWLVELAPLTEPARVPQATAAAFGLPDQPGHTPADALSAHLKDKRPLLILDNCEHLIAACAELAEALLGSCPELHILATSREPLQAAGEVTWRVPSMATPGLNVSSPERLLDCDAVQLFFNQASAAQPDFQLTPENLAGAAQICQQLDGIPLAIEMAAAQVGAMAVQEIAARLDERFTLLVNPRRTALPRQRTLRTTLEWSYHLLSPPEQVLLARLSVFADGCTADGAQAVCADESEVRDQKTEDESRKTEAGRSEPLPLTSDFRPLTSDLRLPASDVLPVLLSLVHKSLVVADTRGSALPGRQTRYRLLETVRQFAAAKLGMNATDEAEVVREQLTAYLISLGRAADEQDTTSIRDQMEAELGNIRAVMAWARARQDGGVMSLRLVTALYRLWVGRGHWIEPLAWLEEALGRGGSVPPELRLKAINMHLRLHYFNGYDLARWTEYGDELQALLEQVDDPVERFEALMYASGVTWDQSDYDRTRVLVERGLALAQQLRYPHGIAVALLRLGEVRLRLGARADALTLYRQVLQLAQDAGDVAMALGAIAQADHRVALALCEQEVARWRMKDDPEGLASILQEYVQTLLKAGDYDRAETHLNECLALWSRLGVQGGVRGGSAPALLNLGHLAWLQGDYARAQMHYEQSLELQRQIGQPGQIAYLRILIGYSMLAQGDFAGASAAFTFGLNLYCELGRRTNLAQALAVMGALASARDHHERAARLYAAAATAATLPPYADVDLLIYEREMAMARSRYCTPEFARFWAEGETMSLEDALDYALAG